MSDLLDSLFQLLSDSVRVVCFVLSSAIAMASSALCVCRLPLGGAIGYSAGV